MGGVRWREGVGRVLGGLGLWVGLVGWTDLKNGVVVWVDTARSTAPAKINKYFIYFNNTVYKPIVDKQK